jgi:uncharacterized protein (DUF433 family)
MSQPLRIRGVWRDLHHQKGRPCVDGTHICTRTVAQRFLTGSSTAECARGFGLTYQQTEDAIRFECCLRARRLWAVRFSRTRLTKVRRGTP